MSKAGVNALTLHLAAAQAVDQIRVNAIAPGLIDTPMGVNAGAVARGITREAYAADRASRVPMGHQGTAWDVAYAALYLASDESRFVSGCVLRRRWRPRAPTSDSVTDVRFAGAKCTLDTAS